MRSLLAWAGLWGAVKAGASADGRASVEQVDDLREGVVELLCDPVPKQVREAGGLSDQPISLDALLEFVGPAPSSDVLFDHRVRCVTLEMPLRGQVEGWIRHARVPPQSTSALNRPSDISMFPNHASP